MDILQTNSYNVVVAKVLGVKSALFLTCLSFDDSEIALSRDIIYNRTGLKDVEQIEVEKSLTSSDVISIRNFRGDDSKHYYKLNSSSLRDVLSYKDLFAPVQESSSATKKTVSRKPKRLIEADSLKSSLRVDSPMLRQYLCDWIDAVYTNPKNCLTKQGIQMQLEDLNKVTVNEDLQIEIIRIAIKRCLRDLNWAIQEWQKDSHTEKCFSSYESTRATRIQIENGEF